MTLLPPFNAPPTQRSILLLLVALQLSACCTCVVWQFSFGKHCGGSIPSGSTFSARENLGFMGCGLDKSGVVSPNVFDNSWHHVCYTYDGSTVRMVVDGVEANSYAVALQTTAVASGGVALIGVHVDAGSWSAFTGSFKDFIIVDHAVSAEELSCMRCRPFQARGTSCPSA